MTETPDPGLLARARHGLAVSWRLAGHDTDAIHDYDTSYDGFWASFWALGLSLPVFLLLTSLEPQIQAAAELPVREMSTGFYLLETVGYAINWLMFPLLMIFIARLLAFQDRYTVLVVAFNWSALFLSLMVLPAPLLFAAGVIGLGTMVIINLIIWALSLYYRWLVFTTAIGGQGFTGFGLLLLDVLTSLIIGELINRMHGPA